jgi:hypothetical protein
VNPSIIFLLVNAVLPIEVIVNNYRNVPSSWIDAEGKKEFAADFAAWQSHNQIRLTAHWLRSG